MGRCAVCEGIGEELLPDLDKIVLNSNLSISEGLFEHNKTLDYYGNSGSQYMAVLKEIGTQHDFSLETPFIALSEQQKELFLREQEKRYGKRIGIIKRKQIKEFSLYR